jgi:hypothetical protein
MDKINFTLISFIFLVSCSVTISKSKNETNISKIEKFRNISKSMLDSILLSNQVESLDSIKFLNLISNNKCRILTHSFSLNCGFSKDVLNQIKSLDKENDSICPFFIITSYKNLDFEIISTIMSNYNVKFYYQYTDQFNYFKYLKRTYKIEKPKLLYIIKNGLVIKNINNVKDI